MDPYESYLQKNGLVVNTVLRRWHDESPDLSITELCIRHSDMLRVDFYLEQAARQEDFPPVWPPGNCRALPAAAYREPWLGWLTERGVILLRDGEHKLVGVTNPFRAKEDMAAIAKVMNTGGLEVRLVCPHLLAAARSYALTNPPMTDPLPVLSLEEWAKALGLLAGNDLTLSVIEAQAATLQTDVLPPGYLRALKPVEGTQDIGTAFTSNSHVWLAGPAAATPENRNTALQVLGLVAHPFLVSPDEYRRLAKPPKKADIAHQPLVCEEWRAPKDDKIRGQLLFRELVEFGCLTGASDLHFEPQGNRVRVRFRINSLMYEQAPLPNDDYAAVLRTAKIEGACRQAISNARQDGACSFTPDCDKEPRELRINIGIHRREYEAMVIRIQSRKIYPLSALDMTEETRRVINWFLKSENGLFIISGPVCSGKTTTLYACLDELARDKCKIITIEHPSEKTFPPAVQFDLRDGGAFTAQDAFHCALRQNIDALMVGELREQIYADTAVSVALSGHKVLCTVHAPDAIGVLDRLMDGFGIKRSVIGGYLKAVLAQRLVLRLCPSCKRVETIPAAELREFPDVGIASPIKASPVGCPSCREGYVGQFAIAEALVVDSKLRPFIQAGESLEQLRIRNRARGFRSLAEQATALAFTGEITLDEARRFLEVAPV